MFESNLLFLKSLNPNTEEYQSIRGNILDKTYFSSAPDFHKYEGYNDLKNLRNIYLNLKSSKQWLDVCLALEVLDIEVRDEDKGKFDALHRFCISEIERYFIRENRNEILASLV